jgi:hypothetical protein
MVNLLNAQITTNEQPYSWNNPDGLVTKEDIIVLPVPDKVRIENEDKINDQKQGPLRYAYPVPVNFTAENSGYWQTLNDGSKLWILNVKLPGALSANAMYDKFWLPEGAKFFVYSNETKQFIGAVTSEFLMGSSKEPAVFATAIIYGENITFEYYQPAFVKESAVISISRIDYGYRYVNNPYEETTEVGASLQQNSPNPFSQSTVIRYTLPQTDKQAQLVVSSMAGQIVRQIPLQSGEAGSITIEGGSLSAGIYHYSLYVGGSLVDTKKMILTK